MISDAMITQQKESILIMTLWLLPLKGVRIFLICTHYKYQQMQTF